MTLHDSAPHNGSQPVDATPVALNDEHQRAPDTASPSGGAPTAEQPSPASTELETEDDPLAENFLPKLEIADVLRFGNRSKQRHVQIHLQCVAVLINIQQSPRFAADHGGGGASGLLMPVLLGVLRFLRRYARNLQVSREGACRAHAVPRRDGRELRA